MLAVISAVFSTIDSAILAPAGVLAQNVFNRTVGDRMTSLRLNQLCVVAVTAASLATAFIGQDAYELLENAYALGFVSLLVPLLLGVWWDRGGEHAALASMFVGLLAWLVHALLGWEHFMDPSLAHHLPLPVALCSAMLSALTFVCLALSTQATGRTLERGP
jgi:SSS family solute:Na+ symporter